MTRETLLSLAARITGQRRARALDTHGLIPVRYHSGRRAVFVPSCSAGARCYKVTADDCRRVNRDLPESEWERCPGFAHRGYCRHHDAVVLRLADGTLTARGGDASPAPAGAVTLADLEVSFVDYADGTGAQVLPPVCPDRIETDADVEAFAAWLDECEREQLAAEALAELFPEGPVQGTRTVVPPAPAIPSDTPEGRAAWDAWRRTRLNLDDVA